MKKMMRIIMLCLLVLSSAAFSLEANAQKDGQQKRSVGVRGATVDNPVAYLGKSFDKNSGKFVDGYAIVHFAKSSSRPIKPTPTSSCFGYIAKGAKWKNVETWTVDAAMNSENIDPYILLNNMESDIAKWEDATDGIIGNNVGANILGQGSVGTTSSSLGVTLDNKNEVELASIDSPGAIAVTYIWGIFGGLTSRRELVEWDQVYDDADFNWSMSGEAGKMDFENIATHELGHSVGMGDLYTSDCSAQTMYGYAGDGETNKRTLEAGDIAGIKALYK